jgi:hypothetical protein
MGKMAPCFPSSRLIEPIGYRRPDGGTRVRAFIVAAALISTSVTSASGQENHGLSVKDYISYCSLSVRKSEGGHLAAHEMTQATACMLMMEGAIHGVDAYNTYLNGPRDCRRVENRSNGEWVAAWLTFARGNPSVWKHRASSVMATFFIGTACTLPERK